jgi:hypothetical protein
MGSEKSPLNSSDSSWAKAFLAMTNSFSVSKATKKREGGPQIFTFKCLLHIDGFLGASLEIWDPTLRLAKGHGAFR